MQKKLTIDRKRHLLQFPCMKHRGEQLIQCMLEDMNKCKQRSRDLPTELECRFDIINRYCNLLQTNLAAHQFQTTEEEIGFFKQVKPRFIAEKLYCGLMSHASLFKSSTTDPVSLHRFWTNELSRFEKFTTEHQPFWEYLASGSTSQDAEWFTRQPATYTPKDASGSMISSSHDWLVSNLLALKKYKCYVKAELGGVGEK